jgi:hypothetical protein
MLPNKENLVFTGKWRTTNGSIGIVVQNKEGDEPTILRIQESKEKCFIGFEFTIDSLGKCLISHAFDLVARIRDL